MSVVLMEVIDLNRGNYRISDFTINAGDIIISVLRNVSRQLAASQRSTRTLLHLLVC